MCVILYYCYKEVQSCVQCKKKGNVTLAGPGADVGDKSSSAGVWLGGALLAGVAPCSSNGCTAECFGAHDPTELTLTHLVVHLGETRPSPVVCGRGGTTLINTHFLRKSRSHD